ncbi:MAG: hypothetical protein HS128_03220 [Ideonella sp.]|nr:hypothetical protein [Ideonella sp.]
MADLRVLTGTKSRTTLLAVKRPKPQVASPPPPEPSRSSPEALAPGLDGQGVFERASVPQES